MLLNTLKPADGANREKKILGRGQGSGLGKTSGKGHKGQKARSGGFHKVGFEGGQTPLQVRLPKVGFVSRKAKFVTDLRLDAFNNLDVSEINLQTLKDLNLINGNIKAVKVVNTGEIKKAIKFKGIKATAAAKLAIEAAGGSVEE